jgi:hypothetical protein
MSVTDVSRVGRAHGDPRVGRFFIVGAFPIVSFLRGFLHLQTVSTADAGLDFVTLSIMLAVVSFL